MIKIDGKKIAEEILSELKQKILPKKFLAIFSVSPDRAIQSFVLQKKKTADRLGVDFRIYNFDNSVVNDFLRSKIREIVNSKNCGGAILQLPLPEQINDKYVINVIPGDKDVELMTSRSMGDYYKGRTSILPPSVEVVLSILREREIEIKDIKTIAIVGYGKLVGRPIAHYFTEIVSETLILDKGSSLSMLKNADLVISGTGVSGLLKQEMFKKGAGVIDFGYGMDKKTGLLSGDIDLKSIDDSEISFYTSTPGGTGPILVASLFKNFYTICNEADK